MELQVATVVFKAVKIEVPNSPTNQELTARLPKLRILHPKTKKVNNHLTRELQ